MNKPSTNKNHFLPAFYLKAFEDADGKLWCYDKTSNKIFSGKARSLGFENGLYHPESPADKNKYEDWLTEEIENPALLLLKQLRNKEIPKKEDREDRIKLARYLASLLVRTPVYITHLKKQFDKEFRLIDWALAQQKYDMEIHGKFFSNEEDYVECMQYTLNGKIETVVTRDFTLKSMSWCVENISILMARMCWALIESPDKKSFVTSDNIFKVYNPHFGAAGLGLPGSMLHIPISRKLTLRMTMLVNSEQSNDGYLYDVNNCGISEAEFFYRCAMCNLSTFDLAKRFIYADSKQVLQAFQ
jgi:hypothetical protein